MRTWKVLVLLARVAVLLTVVLVALWQRTDLRPQITGFRPSDSIVPTESTLPGPEAPGAAAQASGDPIGPADYEFVRGNMSLLELMADRRDGRPPQTVPAPESGPDPAQVLRRVLLDLLTNPDLKSTREFYGRPGDKRLALQSDSMVPWPRGWHANVPGYIVGFRNRRDTLPDPRLTPRQLGADLRSFDLDPTLAKHQQIEICLFNIGGCAGDEAMPIGGCSVNYAVKKEKEKWVVEFVGYDDP